MAENDLKKQLDILFKELERAKDNAVISAEDELELRLDDLFSPEESGAGLLRLNVARLENELRSGMQTAPPAVSVKPTQTAAARVEPQAELAQQMSQWGIDPLLEVLAAGNQDMATAALVNLLQRSDAASRHLLATTKKTGRAATLDRGSEVFISHLLGQKFVYVPPGPFQMGSDPQTDPLAEATEMPRHSVNLPGFWMARYLVTAAQFGVFVKQSGYRPLGPASFSDRGNLPVANVTWHDALAYCRWWQQRSGLPVTLPSEAEWEKAARGSDGRRYPWGDEPPDPSRCHFSEMTPVGQFSPQSDSPYGCTDMAGNVWEWTRSHYQRYPYNPHDGRERLDLNLPRTVRGLTFNNPNVMTRAAYRHQLAAKVSLPRLGFRLAVSPG